MENAQAYGLLDIFSKVEPSNLRQTEKGALGDTDTRKYLHDLGSPICRSEVPWKEPFGFDSDHIFHIKYG